MTDAHFTKLMMFDGLWSCWECGAAVAGHSRDRHAEWHNREGK